MRIKGFLEFLTFSFKSLFLLKKIEKMGRTLKSLKSNFFDDLGWVGRVDRVRNFNPLIFVFKSFLNQGEGVLPFVLPWLKSGGSIVSGIEEIKGDKLLIGMNYLDFLDSSSRDPP